MKKISNYLNSEEFFATYLGIMIMILILVVNATVLHELGMLPMRHN